MFATAATAAGVFSVDFFFFLWQNQAKVLQQNRHGVLPGPGIWCVLVIMCKNSDCCAKCYLRVCELN